MYLRTARHSSQWGYCYNNLSISLIIQPWSQCAVCVWLALCNERMTFFQKKIIQLQHGIRMYSMWCKNGQSEKVTLDNSPFWKAFFWKKSKLICVLPSVLYSRPTENTLEEEDLSSFPYKFFSDAFWGWREWRTEKRRRRRRVLNSWEKASVRRKTHIDSCPLRGVTHACLILVQPPQPSLLSPAYSAQPTQPSPLSMCLLPSSTLSLSPSLGEAWI